MVNWRVKVTAILHDPITKALGLIGHERKAKELMGEIGLEWKEPDKSIVSEADRIASAADRIPLYKGEGQGRGPPSIDWRGRNDIALYHPLSSRSLLNDNLEITDLSNIAERISVESKPALSSAEELIPNRDRFDSEIEDKIVQKYRTLSEASNSDDEVYRKLFLWLWRTLDTLHGQTGFQGFILSWLPADTRIPDHSIYDHLITASSFVTPNPCLLAFDIGGVGDFISQSRKTRDLWASSYLVSLAALAGMMVVVRKFGPDSILFPDLRKHPLIDLYLHLEGVLTKEELFGLWDGEEGFVEALFVPSTPGTFTIIASKDQAEDLIKEIKSAIERFFDGTLEVFNRYLSELVGDRLVFDWEGGIPYPLSLRVAEVSFEDVSELERKTRGCGDDLDCIRRALEEAIPEELRRVVIESDGNETYDLVESMARLILVRNKFNGYQLRYTYLYPIAYRLLQLKMASMKLLADFKYLEIRAEVQGLPVRRRCKLCGARNPVVLTEVPRGMPKDERGGWRFFLNKLEEGGPKSISLLLDQDEPLCPVCLVKRLLRSFPIEIWSQVLGRDAREIEDKLRELGLLYRVKEVARDIPTLDDVATAPAKRFLKEEIYKNEEKAKRFLYTLHSAVGSLILFYRSVRREWEGSEKIRAFISELGSRYPSLIEKGFDDLAKTELEEKLEDPLQIPGALLYEAFWREVRALLHKALEDGEIGEDSYKTWVEHFDQLIELLGGREGYKELVDRLSNYVAFVYFDGDRIGDWFTGTQLIEKGVKFSDRLHPRLREYLNSQNILSYMSNSYKLVTPSYHRTLSRIMRELASGVYPHLVESLDGLVFYSGGDDLLAVVPASGGFPLKLLTALHTAFNSDIIKIRGNFILGMGNKATGSSGVVVAHRLVPMSTALEDVRREEAVAKGDLKPEEGELPEDGRDRSSIIRVSRGMSEMRAVLVGDLLRIKRDWKGISELSDEVYGRIKGRGDIRLSNSFLRDMIRYMDVFSMAAGKPGDDPELLEGLLRRCADRNLTAPNQITKEKEVNEIVRLYMRLADLSEKAPIRSSPLYHAHLALVLMSKEVI